MFKSWVVLLVGVVPSTLAMTVVPVPLVWAMSASEVAQVAKPLSVAIATDSGNGSGVIIARNGDRYTVLTAAHVVLDRQQKYNITTTSGNQYALDNSTIRSFPQSVDLAIAEFTSSKAYPIAKLGNSDSASEGSIAFVSGFPRTTLTISKSLYSFREGKIVANSSQPLEGGYGIIYSANTLPGMSGGGVFNDRGELIAIHGRGDVDPKYRADDVNPNIRFKTGNDLGIPINTYTRLVSSLPAAPTVAAQPPAVRRSTIASNHFVNAVGQAQRNDHRGAIENYNRAIQANPTYAAAYLNRGVSKAAVGDNKGSLADQDRSLAIDPNQSSIYVNRGSLRYQAGDLQGALANYTKAIALNKSDPLAYYNRAVIYGELERWSESVADYTQVVTYTPEDVAAYYNRGLGYSKLNKRAEAIADFDRVIKLQSNHFQAFLSRANMKYQTGQQPGALADYTQAIALKPDYALAYRNRAAVHLKLRNKAAAKADLQQAATLYRAQGQEDRYQEALEVYRLIGD